MKRRGEQQRRHTVPEAMAPYDPLNPNYEKFLAQEYSFEKKHAKEEWRDLRTNIMSEGGIRPTKGLDREWMEQAGIPKSVIRLGSRFTADQFAAWYGYDYTDDFADFVRVVYENHLKHAGPVNRPRKLPKIKHIRHGRRRVTAITRKPHPSKPAGAKIKADLSKYVIVKAHTRRCPGGKAK